MSVTMATNNRLSACPPLCQLLYSPRCERLRKLQGSSQSVLGALQIMTGGLAIGFSTALRSESLYWWFAIFYIIFGITCILSERFPSPCLVIVNVILNLSGVVLAIRALVVHRFYSGYLWYSSSWSCVSDGRGWYGSWRRTPTLSPEDQALVERCEEGQQVYIMLVRGIILVKYVLPSLELCLVLSSAILGIKALQRRRNKKPVRGGEGSQGTRTRLRALWGRSQTALGALQIMVGVVSCGLGSALIYTDVGSTFQMYKTKFPIWLGVLFIIFGIASILSGKFPCTCMLVASVIFNLSGVAFAITGVALYSINMATSWDYFWFCHNDRDNRERRIEQDYHERCLEAKQMVTMIVRSAYILPIVLLTLELCLVISSATLNIKALRWRAANKSAQEPGKSIPLQMKTSTEPTD